VGSLRLGQKRLQLLDEPVGDALVLGGAPDQFFYTPHQGTYVLNTPIIGAVAVSHAWHSKSRSRMQAA
jgi:hypothetical protein